MEKVAYLQEAETHISCLGEYRMQKNYCPDRSWLSPSLTESDSETQLYTLKSVEPVSLGIGIRCHVFPTI